MCTQGLNSFGDGTLEVTDRKRSGVKDRMLSTEDHRWEEGEGGGAKGRDRPIEKALWLSQ